MEPTAKKKEFHSVYQSSVTSLVSFSLCAVIQQLEHVIDVLEIHVVEEHVGSVLLLIVDASALTVWILVGRDMIEDPLGVHQTVVFMSGPGVQGR